MCLGGKETVCPNCHTDSSKEDDGGDSSFFIEGNGFRIKMGLRLQSSILNTWPYEDDELTRLVTSESRSMPSRQRRPRWPRCSRRIRSSEGRSFHWQDMFWGRRFDPHCLTWQTIQLILSFCKSSRITVPAVHTRFF